MAIIPRDDNFIPGSAPSVSEADGAAASGLTILAAAGAATKNRIFKIILTCDQIRTLVLSDGFGTHLCAVGVPIVLDYGSVGKAQNTNNTAITVTTTTPASVGALILYKTE